MFYAALSLIALFGAHAAAAANATVSKINPNTVDTLDLNKYIGNWFQMAADKIVMETFDKASYCSVWDQGRWVPFRSQLCHPGQSRWRGGCD